MPGSLPAWIIGWLATHLVAASLVIFLIVGLSLGGHISFPDTAAWFGSKRVAPVSTALPEPPKAPAMPLSQPEVAVESPQPEKPGLQGLPGGGEALRPIAPLRQPRLIGGSIPVYPDYNMAGGTPAERIGFRPSGTTEPQQPTRDDLVQRARRAFWNGDFEMAERLYFDLIDGNSDDPELFGEIGNLYMAMGRQQLALDAYFEAGLRLRSRGDRRKLSEVIRILSEKGDQRALELAP
jgi:hypothetical protein